MVWDKELPAEGALAPTYNNIMRANQTALEAALNAYFYFATGGVQTGQPRQGLSRPYYQDTAPATRLDGDHFDSTDLGCLWIDSNSSIDNQFNWLSEADGAGSNTWTPISTEIIAFLLAANRIFAGTLKSTGDFTVGANKMVVTAANGNTTIAGVATVGKGSLLASSDAPTTNPMIAHKKYVNDEDTADHPAYTGGESHTDGSGLITKMGIVDYSTTLAKHTVTFGTAFPNGIISVQCTFANNGEHTHYGDHLIQDSEAVTKFDYWIQNADTDLHWFAVGY